MTKPNSQTFLPCGSFWEIVVKELTMFQSKLYKHLLQKDKVYKLFPIVETHIFTRAPKRLKHGIIHCRRHVEKILRVNSQIQHALQILSLDKGLLLLFLCVVYLFIYLSCFHIMYRVLVSLVSVVMKNVWDFWLQWWIFEFGSIQVLSWDHTIWKFYIFRSSDHIMSQEKF